MRIDKTQTEIFTPDIKLIQLFASLHLHEKCSFEIEKREKKTLDRGYCRTKARRYIKSKRLYIFVLYIFMNNKNFSHTVVSAKVEPKNQ